MLENVRKDLESRHILYFLYDLQGWLSVDFKKTRCKSYGDKWKYFAKRECIGVIKKNGEGMKLLFNLIFNLCLIGIFKSEIYFLACLIVSKKVLMICIVKEAEEGIWWSEFAEQELV